MKFFKNKKKCGGKKFTKFVLRETHLKSDVNPYCSNPGPPSYTKTQRAKSPVLKYILFNEISTYNYLQVDDILRNTIIDNSERIATPF